MSLTNTSKSFKKGIKILGIVMVVYYIAILFVIPTTKEIILNLLVDRNPPNPKYGKMEPLKFVPADIATADGKLPPVVLDTKDGRLPAGLPKKMVIYKHKGIQFSYLAGKGSQADADALGFSEAELISDLKGKEYSWRSLVSGGVLYINTETRAFNIETEMFGKTDEFERGSIDKESAKKYAEEILQKLGRFDSTIYKSENYKVTLGGYAGNVLIDTTATSDAQLARVDLFGKIGDYPILSPDAKKGLVWFILRAPTRGSTSPYNYPVAEGYFWDLTDEKDATYPIISVQEAWKNVAAGKAIVSSVRQKNYNPFEDLRKISLDRVLINKVYLAYYETPEFQKFLQPIYVFEGKFNQNGSDGGDIVLYYPALTAEYTRSAASTTTQQSSPSSTAKNK